MKEIQNLVFAKDAPTAVLENGTVVNLLSYNKELTVMHNIRPAGAVFPPHAHPEIQIYIIVSGKMELDVNNEIHTLTDGDTWIIPPNVPHGAKVIEETEEFEVFNPGRYDLVQRYLKD